MSKIGETRNSFVKMRGGKLISIEAVILAVVVFFILTMVKNTSPYVGLIAAFIVGFVFPVLVGTFKTLAWLAAILFSLVWALLASVFAAAIANGSILTGLLAGVIFFAVSFIVHKNYSGLSLQRINRKKHDIQNVITNDYTIKESVSFCPKCGRRIRALNGSCDVCDK